MLLLEATMVGIGRMAHCMRVNTFVGRVCCCAWSSAAPPLTVDVRRLQAALCRTPRFSQLCTHQPALAA